MNQPNGRVFRPITDDSLTDRDLQVARMELNETPQNKEVALQKLREKLQQEEGLTPRTDEAYLLRFLRARKFDGERARSLLLKYYKMRSKEPELFRTPADLEKAIKASLALRIHYRDQQGRAVFVIRAGVWDPEVVSLKEFVSVVTLVSEMILEDPVAQINGVVGLWDTKGFSFKQFIQVCRGNGIGLMNSLLQDCFPGRMKAIYCINCSAIIRSFWKVLNPLMKEKIRKRIHILGCDLSELHRFVDPCILPEEYGGQLPDFNHERN